MVCPAAKCTAASQPPLTTILIKVSDNMYYVRLKQALRFISFILYVWEFACMCTTCLLGVHGGHKKALDPFELGMMVVNHYEGAMD